MSVLPPGVADYAYKALFPEPDPYANDPAGWVQGKLNGHLWSKQRDIAHSVLANRYTAVHAAHDAGKSYIATALLAWWIETHPLDEVFVVWTAPSYDQVNAVIGRELRAMHATAGLDGRVTLDDRWVVGDRLVGYGRKPADTGRAKETEGSGVVTAFQGIHARYVFVVIDEASGMKKPMFDAVDALVTNENARVLAIGNPDDPTSYFAKICQPGSQAGKGWNVIHIDGLQTPNFTQEKIPERLRHMLLSPTWVQERRDRWGEDSPLWTAKVRGQFPLDDDRAVIPASLVAQARLLEDPVGADDDPIGGVLGCDIARDGSDSNTIVSVFKGRVEVIANFHEPDTTKTADRIEEELLSRDNAQGVLWKAVVDGDGMGGPVVDMLRRRGVPVVEFRGGERAQRPRRYRNRRGEAWFGVRNLLRDNALVLPDDDDLAHDLSAPRWVKDNGRLGVEVKDEIRKRLGRSPDLGDALVMACSVQPTAGDPNPTNRRKRGSLTSDLLGMEL